jgi:hypothetical protein
MQQLILNQYEKIDSVDMNNLQFAVQQGIQDNILYNMFGTPASGVLNGSFKGSYVSQFAFSLAAGCGFFYNSGNTGFTPKNEMILALSAIAGVIVANTNANNRIDLVSLAPNLLAVTATASRYVKTGGVGPVALTTVNKVAQDSYTLVVTPGTPGAVPVAPSLPAGNIGICQILNLGSSAGMSGAGSVTDVRTFLGVPASATSAANTNHNIATGATVQLQLDQLDNATEHQVAVNNSNSPYALSLVVGTGDNAKVFYVDTSTGPFQFNLPAPTKNFLFVVVDVGGYTNINNITMHRNAAEKINNTAADLNLAANYGHWQFMSDGTNWNVVG